MNADLWIAQNRDGSPSSIWKLVFQKMVDGRARRFIVRGFGNSSDASVSVQTQGAVLFIGTRPESSSPTLVFPSRRPFVFRKVLHHATTNGYNFPASGASELALD